MKSIKDYRMLPGSICSRISAIRSSPCINKSAQQGFTLLELLVVIGILGVLATLGLTSFWVYRSDAAYSVIEATMRSSRVSIEGSMNDIDNPPGAVNMSQNTSGAISDAAGRAYLPSFQVPKNVKFSAEYDPACAESGLSGCQSDFVEIKHCLGEEYAQWVRFGDGSETLLPRIAGSGCQ